MSNASETSVEREKERNRKDSDIRRNNYSSFFSLSSLLQVIEKANLDVKKMFLT